MLRGVEGAPVELLTVDEAMGCARRGPLFVIVWRGAPTRERMQRSVDAYDATARRDGAPPAMLAVIEEGSPPPLPRDFVWIACQHDDRAIAAAAAVLDGRDPWFSSMLDAVLSLLTKRRLAHVSKVCSDVSEAAAWLATRIAHPGPLAAFRGAARETVEEVRRAMDASV